MATGTPVKLRPSDAHRWLVCRAAPGYVAQLELAGRLPKVTYDYTVEGSHAHVLAAHVLNSVPLPTGADPDMLTHIQAYVAHVRKLQKKHPGASLLVEHKVEVYYSDRSGYVDVALIVFDKEGRVTDIYVIDLKYGRGVSVKAERNAQMSIYLKSLIKQLADVYTFLPKTKVHLTIWQPRVQGEKTERTWETTVSDIEHFCDWIDEVAKDILASPFTQKFEPGDEQCCFCPAAGLCEARARDLLGEADDALPAVVLNTVTQDPIVPPEPSTLTPEQLARILTVAPVLRKWLTKVEDHALAVMEQGLAQIPGQKLVRGHPGHRKWKSPEAAEKMLRRHFPRDVVTPPKVVSPAQAEVLLKERKARQATWDAFNALITRPEGGLALAPLSDERPSISAGAEAAEHFETEGEELL